MAAEHWQRVEDLWQRAMERPPEARDAFLEQECGSDADLRQEVRGLLASASEAGDHLENLVGQCLESMVDDLTIEQGPVSVLGADSSWIGETFGYVKIEGQLGEGGMGRVYRGVDQRLGRQVALKVLRPEWATDPRMVNRLEREARLLSQLEHPVICRLYDVVQTAAATGLVLELVAGEPLRGVIAGGIPRARVLAWGIDLAEALAEAHAAGIVHRDLKPGNIMHTEAGGLKILDFGIARSIDAGSFPGEAMAGGAVVETTADDEATADDGAAQSATDGTDGSPSGFGEETGSGQISGTLAYMSPEQYRGDAPSPATDVFALGLVLYECLAGAPAYSRRKLRRDFATAILEARVPPLPDAADGLADLVARMTAPAPGARPSSADVAERLRAIRDAPARRRTRRLQIAGVLVLALFAVVMAWQALRVSQEAERANRALELSRVEAERANQQAEEARRVVEVMSGVLEMADPWVAGHQTLATRKQAASEVLREGWGHLQGGSPLDSPTRARLLIDVAEVASGLELDEIASEAAAEALALQIRLYGADHPLVADSLTLVADSDFYAGRLYEGLAKARRALAILDSTAGADPDLIANALNTMSRLTLDLGLYEEALEVSQRMVEIAERGSDADPVDVLDAHFTQALTLQTMAFFEQDMELLEQARRQLEASLKPTIEAFGADHPSTALVLNSLGFNAHIRGDLEAAEEIVRRAVDAMEERLGASATEPLLIKARLGAILRDRGKTEEAAALYREIVPALEKNSGADNLDLVWPLRGRALVEMDLGDVEAAEATIQRALAVAASVFGPAHLDCRELEIDLAQIWAAAGRSSEAEALIAKILSENRDPFVPYLESHGQQALAAIGVREPHMTRQRGAGDG